MVRIKRTQRKSPLKLHNKFIKNRKIQNMSISKNNDSCIIIDTDSENDDMSSDDVIIVDDHKLFYEDLNPGFNNKEIPLYSPYSNKSIENSNKEKNKAKDLNNSVIILNDTIESDVVLNNSINLNKIKNRKKKRCNNNFISINKKVISPKWKDRSTQQLAAKRTVVRTITKKKEETTTIPDKDKNSNLKKRFIVIDGSNVSFSYSKNSVFSVKGLELCINYFTKLGFELKAIVPQYRNKPALTTDHKLLEQLYKEGKVLFTPGKKLNGKYVNSYDDRFILDIAINLDGVVISNDNYNDLESESLEYKNIIESRVVGYTWCNDYLILPKDPYGKFGPTLDEILYIKET